MLVQTYYTPEPELELENNKRNKRTKKTNSLGFWHLGKLNLQ